MIEQAKFTYSLLGKAFEKQTNTIKDQKDHGRQLVTSNELINKDFNINRDSIQHEEQKKYLMKFLEKGLLSFII